MSAFACAPSCGSEEGVGWNWAVQAASRGHDVHVVTQHMHRAEIEAELARRPVEGLTFHYLTVNDAWDRVKNNWTNYSLVSYYYAWQIKLRGLAKRLHEAERFDIVQHVTYVQDWTPSGLMDIPAPFIWGPVGGSANVLPASITNGDMDWPAYALRFERSRRLMQEGLKRFDPFVRRTMAKADRILIYTENGVDVVPARFRQKARPIVHIGVSDFDIPASAARAETVDLQQPFQIMTGGRLVHWKGIDLLIEGFARFLTAVPEAAASGARLLVTGKGDYQPHLQALVERLGLTGHVDFLGFLPTRDDLYMAMTACDVFALPTLRDGPPVGILEAMFAGLPILCLDHGATRELVPRFAGHLVPPVGRDGTVQGIANALAQGYRDRAALWAKGHKAQAHVTDVHHWDRIGDAAEQHYQEVLAAPSPQRVRLSA
ncbi:MAG: glycosyltransferase family 4 protein [Alphaproteobacteria bacterium]